MINKRTRRYGKREPWLENFADELRSNPTKSENLIRQYLEDGISGCKFIFQVPVFGYIPDFICEENKLIIEIDGRVHRFADIKKKDMLKDQVYETYGYRVLRIKEKDIIANIDYVLEDIIDWITNSQNEVEPTVEEVKKENYKILKRISNLSPIPKFEGSPNPLRDRLDSRKQRSG